MGMRWEVTDQLPSRDDFLEMLGKARRNTADAIVHAKRTGNLVLLLNYQLQLADWDRLIERMRSP
jgi:hypothetical protein